MSNTIYSYVGTDGADDIDLVHFASPVFVDARAGDDMIMGPALAGSKISGGAGNDIIYGGQGNDTISGDAGNDQLIGAGGYDVFRFERGSGMDQISQRYGAAARFELGTTVTRPEVEFRVVNESHLLVRIKSTNESATVFGFFDSRVNWQLGILSGGQVFTSAEVRELMLQGGAGDDLLEGFSTSDVINAGAGDDTIYGQGGNDSITGSGGNDWINGGSGFDKIFGGEGADTLIGDSVGDSLSGGAGDDVYLLSGNSVVLEMAGDGLDEVRVEFDSGSEGFTLSDNIENARLASGVAGVLIGNTGRNLIVGGSGDDSLYGRSGADRITGGGGNDLLQGDGGTDRLAGGNGSDTYVYEAGDGIDFINNFTTLSTDKDTLLLKEVSESQLWLTRQGLDLEIGVVGQIDTVVVSNWYLDPRYQLDAIKVADTGKVLTADRVQGLVNAMAAFAPPPLGQAALPASTQAGLAPVMAASWQAA